MGDENQIHERRKSPRYPCEIPFPASFKIAAGAQRALVDEISASGAKLRIERAHDNIPFMVQGCFEYTFHTSLGTSVCKARTAWVQRIGADFIWGIEFVDTGTGNPLNTIIRNLTAQGE